MEQRLTTTTGLTATRGTRHTGPTLTGYAAMFGKFSQDLGGFKEVIRKGAFVDSITTRDVRAFFNHEPNLILGRTKGGTLVLWEDSIGLGFTIHPPDTTQGRDVLELVKHHYVTGMSFGFSLPAHGDSWEYKSGVNIRILHKVTLHEVSVCPIPAYTDTTVSVREASSPAARAALDQRRRRLEQMEQYAHSLR